MSYYDRDPYNAPRMVYAFSFLVAVVFGSASLLLYVLRH